MIDLKSNTLLREIPPNLLVDEKVVNLAKALQISLSDMLEWADKINYKMNIDQLDESIIDHLLWESHITWHEGLSMATTKEQKINLVKSSVKLHRLKGTPAAIEKVLKTLNLNGEVQEWFDYEGEPYYFRIEVDLVNIYEGTLDLLRSLVNEFKNVRSWLEYISIKMKQTNYLKLTHFSYSYPIYYHKCGELITYPIHGLGIGSVIGLPDLQYRYPVYYDPSDTFNTAPTPGANLSGGVSLIEHQYDYPNYYKPADTFDTHGIQGMQVKGALDAQSSYYRYPNYYPVTNVIESEDILKGAFTETKTNLQQTTASMRMLAPVCGIFTGGGM